MPTIAHPTPKPSAGPSWSSETPIRITAFGLVPAPEAGAYLRERIGFKLGKFARQVLGLEIRLREDGASRVSCVLAVALASGEPVQVERWASAPREAFDHALGVAERLLRRQFQRGRHQRT